MVFADTSALAALLIPSDKNHTKALEWMKSNPEEEVITTDYVIDELFTVLLSRTKNKVWVIDTINKFRATKWISQMIFVTQEDFFRAEQLFLAYDDKGWSFTDCTTKVVMEKIQITQAFAFDPHFNQFGSVTVVPL